MLLGSSSYAFNLWATAVMKRSVGNLWPLVAVLFVISICHGQNVTPESDLESGQEQISEEARNWYQWRGPLMTGEAPHANPPLRWSESENVKWKTKLIGLGHSTPIVTADSVYLTLAREIGEKFSPRPDTAPGAHDNKLVSSKFEFVAIAVDRATGKIKWQKVLHSAIPHEGAHVSASLASASPVTDGELIWFHFGTYGLYCLNPAGETLWSKNLGVMNSKHGHGEGASPVLSGDILAINWDHEGQSFVAAFDKKSGDEIWRKDRDEITSWASPIVVEHGGRNQLIVAGTNRIRAYDLKNGDVIWQCGGMSHNIVATPVFERGLVFFGSSYEKRQMLAVKLEGAKGDITSSDNVVWSRNARTPYVPSLLVYRGYLYFLRHYQGILSRLDTRDGTEPSGPFRLGSMNEIYASPVAAAGRIYVTDRKGTTVVISADEPKEQVIVNRLSDRINASAAIAGDELFLRGETTLYCIKRLGNELP